MDKAPLVPAELWEKRVAFAKKVAIWAIFLGLLYLLRHFFALIFLTFLLSFAGNTAVGAICHRFGGPRRLVTIAVSLAFVGLVSFLLYFIGTSFYEQTSQFIVEFKEWSRQAKQWSARLQKEYPELVGLLFGSGEPEHAGAVPATRPRDSVPEPSAIEAKLQKWLAKEVPAFVIKAVQTVTSLLFALILAIVFSFLILFDLPHVTRDTWRLRHSRVGFLYEETAETVVAFAVVVGRMFQAQSVIAMVNTTLTFVGLSMLGVPNLAFLTVVVFLFSFVPIAGVFISSAPVVLVAWNDPSGGFGLAVSCVILVTIVHLIEAYILNPRIMGAHLHMNPVFVLLILFVGGHLAGVWGVLLGVPVITYFFQSVNSTSRASVTTDPNKRGA